LSLTARRNRDFQFVRSNLKQNRGSIVPYYSQCAISRLEKEQFMAKTAHMPQWLKFFKPKIDFFDLLDEQAKITLAGLEGLHEWLKSGAVGECTIVHELEHKADDHKMKIEQSLRDTFVTPFDREEIYDVSANLDCILNGAKKFAKDMEALETRDVDEPLIKMSQILVESARELLSTIENLDRDLKEAEHSANKSRKAEPHVGREYRKTFDALSQNKNPQSVMMKMHFYNLMVEISERIERLGEKLLHISIKMS
jgi:uncharacterized protein Yka (UPF0111/DUF47 family)